MNLFLIVAAVVGVIVLAALLLLLWQIIRPMPNSRQDDGNWKKKVTRERNALRRGLTKSHSPQWVAKLDEMSQWTQRRMQSDPRLKPLITTVMVLTASTEETWGEKAIEDGKDPRLVIDTAFRTTCCCLAPHLYPSPMSDPSFSLSETSDVISKLWSRHPGARVPLAPVAIQSLIRQASDLLSQEPQVHTVFQLGQLVTTNHVLDSTYAAMLVPELAANTYDSIPFSIHESQ